VTACRRSARGARCAPRPIRARLTSSVRPRSLASEAFKGAQLASCRRRRFRTMHNALWGYAIAIALACASLFVKDKAILNVPWLGFALALLACLIALLASLGLAHGKGWLSRITLRARPSQPRSLPMRAEMRPADDIELRQAAPAGRAPRPAGPAGPVPVLEKRPEDAIGDAVATRPSGTGSSKRPSDA
jgi:hypothetical protein